MRKKKLKKNNKQPVNGQFKDLNEEGGMSESSKGNILHPRRKALLTVALGGSAIATAPQKWTTPIINSVVLPAHAQTSTCSGTETEPVNEPILITVTATEINGPVVVSWDGITTTFAGEETTALSSTCIDGSVSEQVVTFNGTIDSANNQITGELNTIQYCGDVVVCEQITTYVANQDPAVAGDDLGVYTGTAVGTISCCLDYL